jgi:hypothetical protein
LTATRPPTSISPKLFAGHPYGAITRDDWLDNSSVYWLTNTATSAARLHWQQAVSGENFYAAANVSLPAAVTVFPEEYVTAPRSWTERAYHKLIYFNEAEEAATSPPGNNRNCFPKSRARRSAHCVECEREKHNPTGAPSLARPAPISTRFRGSAL